MLNYGPGQIFGELVVQQKTSKNRLKPPTQRFGLKWENTIGSHRLCDVCVSDDTVAKRHAVLYMASGQAYISPLGHAEVMINGDVYKRQAWNGDGVCRYAASTAYDEACGTAFV